jgi:hypothetical protein
VLVLVFGVAGGTPGLFDVRPDHRHHRMVGYAAFSWTIVVQNVTKPRLAMLHEESPQEF